MKNKIPPLKFETKRLVVRPLTRSDYREWKRSHLESLPSQSQFDESCEEESELSFSNFLADLKRFRKKAEIGETYNFFAFQKSDGRLIGGCQFWLVQRYECQRTSMGYWIFNNYWKQGFGFELASGLINHGLKKMKLNRIEAEILPDNIPSIELSKKVGMTFEGIRRNSMYFDGSWHDHAIYAITADDIGIIDRAPESEFTAFV